MILTNNNCYKEYKNTKVVHFKDILKKRDWNNENVLIKRTNLCKRGHLISSHPNKTKMRTVERVTENQDHVY